jgi:hypothetical protein
MFHQYAGGIAARLYHDDDGLDHFGAFDDGNLDGDAGATFVGG